MEASSQSPGTPTSSKGRAAKIVGTIFLLVSLLPLAIGLFFLIDTLVFLSSATSTATGTIVSCPRPKSNSSACTPTIAFTTTSGAQVTFTSSLNSSFFAVGQQQPIAYNPDHPQDARIASFLGLWFLPTLLLGLGALFLLIGGAQTAVAFLARRRAKAAMLT